MRARSSSLYCCVRLITLRKRPFSPAAGSFADRPAAILRQNTPATELLGGTFRLAPGTNPETMNQGVKRPLKRLLRKDESTRFFADVINVPAVGVSAPSAK